MRKEVTSAKLFKESSEILTAPLQADSATATAAPTPGSLTLAWVRPVSAVVQGSLQPLDRGGLQRVCDQSHQVAG